jgi:hypothetical protein
MRGGGEALDAGPDTTGLAGVLAFAGGYDGWAERFGDRLERALRGLAVFVVKAGTGGALFRSLHAGFLHDAGELLGDPELRGMGRLYDELSGAWRAVAEAASDDDPERAHAAARAPVQEAARLETAGVEAMERWVDV